MLLYVDDPFFLNSTIMWVGLSDRLFKGEFSKAFEGLSR